MPFTDRADAGRQLAGRLRHLAGRPVVVLGIPRGGMPVALEVARFLRAPLDVVLVRKLGVPVQPELAMGAIGEDGVRIVNREVVAATGVSREEFGLVAAAELAELQRRALRYRGGRPRTPVRGRTAIVVDDGLATGSSAQAACRVVRAHGAAEVVLAVPVAPAGWTARLCRVADHMVAVETPDHFYAIGQFYDDFSQTSDEEVVACLEAAAGRAVAPDVASRPDGEPGAPEVPETPPGAWWPGAEDP